MNKDWKLELVCEPADEAPVSFNLDMVRTDGHGPPVRLITGCSSLDDFETALAELRSAFASQLDSIFEQAREVAARQASSQEEAGSEHPEEIWTSMEAMAEEDFCDFFNGLPEITRRNVAEFVFTQVNMFKGKAPVFAARFDNDSGRLC
jgi:hypothetical protein